MGFDSKRSTGRHVVGIHVDGGVVGVTALFILLGVVGVRNDLHAVVETTSSVLGDQLVGTLDVLFLGQISTTYQTTPGTEANLLALDRDQYVQQAVQH